VLQRIRAVRKNDGGFTLTELLITIVILGVLAGVVVFAVTGFTDDGKKVACSTEKKNVEIAVEAFYAKKSHFPTNGLDSVPAAGTDLDRLQALITAGLLKELPSTTNGYTISLVSGTGVVGPLTCPF